MRVAARRVSTVVIGVGVLALVWAVVVWAWQDPFTALYTRWQQHRLSGQYTHLRQTWSASHPVVHSSTVQSSTVHSSIVAAQRQVAADAALLQRQATPGQAIGKIFIPRLGLDMILVYGTDHDSLTRGPGVDPETRLPGANRLVYIAGHRTTYLAPFAHIDVIRAGDLIRIEMPYATFVYRAFRHEIVPADDMAVLRSPDHELLRLQACHPRFFATHRYLVDADLVRVKPTGERGWTVATSSPRRAETTRSASTGS
jgi:sortase A